MPKFSFVKSSYALPVGNGTGPVERGHARGGKRGVPVGKGAMPLGKCGATVNRGVSVGKGAMPLGKCGATVNRGLLVWNGGNELVLLPK